MATFSEIKSVRLIIDDPIGFIDFKNIALLANLPSAPSNQTAYLVDETGNYMATEVLSGAVESDYDIQELLFSDETISDLLDSYAQNIVLCKLYRLALPKILKRMNILRNESGAESFEYQSLKSKYDAYKEMIKDCDSQNEIINNNHVGQYLHTKSPTIAGGDL